MKFKSSYYLIDKLGQTRVRRKFLLWPRKFYNQKYIYWLCYALVEEEVVTLYDECGTAGYRWSERRIIQGDK